MSKNIKKVKESRILRRKWLNGQGHHSTASVFIDGTFGPESGWGEMTISDCYRPCTLDLGYTDKGELKNVLHKLETLEASIREVRKFIKTNARSK